MKRGAALPAVLLAMTMASALAVGGAYLSRQHAAAARLANRSGMLQPSAETALIDALASWDSAARADQPVGSVRALSIVSGTTFPTEVWITRASQRLYWLVAEAVSASRPTLRRRLGVLVTDSSGVVRLVPRPAWAELP